MLEGVKKLQHLPCSASLAVAADVSVLPFTTWFCSSKLQYLGVIDSGNCFAWEVIQWWKRHRRKLVESSNMVRRLIEVCHHWIDEASAHGYLQLGVRFAFEPMLDLVDLVNISRSSGLIPASLTHGSLWTCRSLSSASHPNQTGLECMLHLWAMTLFSRTHRPYYPMR